MKLILYIGMTDTALSLISYTTYHVCPWGLYQLFAQTVYFRSDPFAYQRALWVLAVSANYFSITLIFLTFALNAFLAVDLILMLKYPFKSKESRVPLYVVFSILVTLVLTTSWVMTESRNLQGTIKPAKWVMVFAVSIIVV